MPAFDSDWLWSLFGQGQQPPAGSAPQPQPPASGLSLNGYNPAIPGARLPVISDAVSAPPAAPQSTSSQGGGYPSQGDRYWWPQVAQGVWNAAKSGATLPGDVASGKATMEDPATQGRVGDMASVAMVGAGGAPAEPGALNMGIRAYHASPYDFDRFDTSKIGTGEGAQVYGHGLYFAENPDVADQYRQGFSAAATVPGSPEELARDVMDHPAIAGDRAKAIAELESHQEDWKTRSGRAGMDPSWQGIMENHGNQGTQAAIDRLNDPNWDPLRSGAHSYEVDINAEPNRFLDWDRPIGEQHPDVVDAAADMATRAGVKMSNATTGEVFYNNLLAHHQAATGNLPIGDAAARAASRAQSSAAVTQQLADAGVPGIKYLDQGSRGAGGEGGTQNYVTFTDNIVKIMRKYGIGALGAAGAGDMMLGGQSKSSSM